MKKIILLAATMLMIVAWTQAQVKSTLAVKDLNKTIEKYIKNHYETHQTVEAYAYNTVYLMKVQRADSSLWLVFNQNEDFQSPKPADFDKKVEFQTKSTMSVDDVDKSITKYIKKNYEGFELTQALRYDMVYTVKLAKAEAIVWLLFDSKGGFLELLEN
jgi:uncharacterized protein YlbG (UPF0298 family)